MLSLPQRTPNLQFTGIQAPQDSRLQWDTAHNSRLQDPRDTSRSVNSSAFKTTSRPSRASRRQILKTSQDLKSQDRRFKSTSSRHCKTSKPQGTRPQEPAQDHWYSTRFK
jgi:hypothetical protein